MPGPSIQCRQGAHPGPRLHSPKQRSAPRRSAQCVRDSLLPSDSSKRPGGDEMPAPADKYTNDQITAEMTKIAGDGVSMDAILARPKEGGPHPAVIIVHENMGIDAQNDTAGPHFDDLARRFARQGFVGI